MSMIPASRPQQTREETLAILSKHGVNADKGVVLLGVRGYYKDSMGKAGVNDMDIYDDAVFVVSPDCYQSFNFNTDPSKHYGTKLAKLDPGVYRYYMGDHHIGTPKAYKALRPYPEGVKLPCTRDGVKSLCANTNIHEGGNDQPGDLHDFTGSMGCQTVPKGQFRPEPKDFQPLVYAQMEKYGQKTVTYVLIEN